MKIHSLLFSLILLGSLSGAALCWAAADASSKSSTFQVGDFTVVRIDGQDATFSQLKKGMRAYVTPDSFQAGYAAKIDAHTAKSAGAAPAPAKGSKAAPALPSKHWFITALTPKAITVSWQSAGG
ncbi:MAG: hypothetical protein PW734_07270 [Verrucomicrobium sp.]|nr:hypothetical protein [Verrucomicrobium sp.]